MVKPYRANVHWPDLFIDRELTSLSIRHYERIPLTPRDYIEAIGHCGLLVLTAGALVVLSFCL